MMVFRVPRFSLDLLYCSRSCCRPVDFLAGVAVAGCGVAAAPRG